MATATRPRRRPGQLPPGRHKLGREHVESSQRGRLRDAATSAVAELGYYHVILGDVVARAGVSRKTFYIHYPLGFDQCFLDAYREAMVGALSGPRVRRLSHFLEYFADRPLAARAFLIETGATPELREMRREHLAELVPKTTADAAVGALIEMVDGALRRGAPLSQLETAVKRIASTR